MECSNMRNSLDRVKADLFFKLDKMYSPDAIPTVAALKELMEQDDQMLLRLSQKAFDDTEDAVLEALVKDGVQYPSFIWNRENVGQQIKLPGIVSLKEHAPLLTSASPSSEGNPNKKYTGTGICLGGGAVAVYALSCDPISLALLAVGVAVLAAGGVTIWKSSPKKADGAARQDEVEQIPDIPDILNKQCKSCRKTLDAWFKNVVELVEAAVDQPDEGR